MLSRTDFRVMGDLINSPLSIIRSNTCVDNPALSWKSLAPFASLTCLLVKLERLPLTVLIVYGWSSSFGSTASFDESKFENTNPFYLV